MQNSRKQKKRKKREREKRARTLAEKAHGRRRNHRLLGPVFPRVLIEDASEAPPGLLALVEDALREIRLGDPRQFKAHQRSFFELQRQLGVDTALAAIQRVLGVEPRTWIGLRRTFLNAVGKRLFTLLRERGLESYIPFTDIQVLPVGRHYAVVFRSLTQRRSRFGTIYSSRHAPTLTHGGVTGVVGWTGHAIQRTCQRVVPNWQSYLGVGEAYSFFDRCLHFEPCTLPNGSPAFTFYERIEPDSGRYRLVQGVVGMGVASQDAQFYVRLGYCPVVKYGNYFVAKTLLLPGFRNTPEYEVLCRADLSRERRAALKARAESTDFVDQLKTGDFTLLRLFHDRGVPQVREFATPLYADPASPRLNRLRAG